MEHIATPEGLFLIGVIFLIFLVAFLYSSVGHGGASGYLAIMALTGFQTSSMRPTALILNILVSGIAFMAFYRGGNFQWRMLWPFLAGSVPLAYLGGMTTLSDNLYRQILGIMLLVATLRMLFKSPAHETHKPVPIFPALVIGMAIGYVSGLIGIGGGIILTPVMVLMGWGTMRQVAAVSAAFIFLNSIAGLAGVGLEHLDSHGAMGVLIIAAFTGGMLGSHFGSRRFKSSQMRYILAVVLLIAGIKLIFA